MFDLQFKMWYSDNPWVIVYDMTPVIGRAQ